MRSVRTNTPSIIALIMTPTAPRRLHSAPRRKLRVARKVNIGNHGWERRWERRPRRQGKQRQRHTTIHAHPLPLLCILTYPFLCEFAPPHSSSLITHHTHTHTAHLLSHLRSNYLSRAKVPSIPPTPCHHLITATSSAALCIGARSSQSSTCLLLGNHMS